MRHLSLEVLARLVDEAPTEDETSHLAACDVCSAELDALQTQTEALSQLPDIRPNPEEWAVVEARLTSEGLLESRRGLRVGLAHTPGWMKMAAALALFFSGAGTGAALANREGVPQGPASSAAVLAANQVTTADEAAEYLALAERQYHDAVVRYRQLSPPDGRLVPDPETRIASLEYLTRAGQTALQESPADPFINGLVVAAFAELDAEMRRVSGGTPGAWY